MPGRRYSDGLHQAIEAKEHVKVRRESKTLATITFQNFFNKYAKKAGMTGTALTEEQEFREIYGMDVIEIPTNRPVQRVDLDDAVYMTKKEKFRAVVEEIKKAHAKNQPVLVGTITIETSELLSNMLRREGIAHQVLNAMSVISGIRLINDTMKIPQDKIFEGIKKAQLQGRVQILSREPLLILDGAHNPDGLSALAGVLEHCPKRPCYAVMGMCRDKNITEAVKKLIPYVDKFYTVDGFSDRAETASDLADIITNAGGRAEQSPKPALEMARQLINENPHGVNLICGSLFLCAQVLNEMKDI